MKPRPVRRSVAPAYPTRLQALADPLLLEAKIPPGWRSSSATAAGVMAFLAANLAGCSEPAENDAGMNSIGEAIVAPVFTHGSGRGSMGCVVVNPPTFLSEEEALQIIREELARAGVEPLVRSVALEGVRMPERPSPDDPSPNEVPIAADLHDAQRKIAVEFVSRADHLLLAKRPRMASTVYSIDIAEVARRLRDEVEESGSGVYFGTFYDPMSRLDSLHDRESWLRRERERYERKRTGDLTVEPLPPLETPAHELLREQVRDFVQWLEGQGAI